MREIEMVKQGFYQAVMLGRGDRLKIGPDTLLRGQIWSGTEALRLGLIDELGTESDAVRKAASLANIWHYKIVDMHDYLNPVSSLATGTFFITSPEGVTLPYPSAPGMYLLYIPPLPATE
jgi:protease-4